MQYRVLREGGTERPDYSVREGESRPGLYPCAGCGAALLTTRARVGPASSGAFRTWRSRRSIPSPGD
jgi:peptide methionine sulfoxide reductase MsrB